MPAFLLQAIEESAAEGLGTTRAFLTDVAAYERLAALARATEAEHPLPPEAAVAPPVVFDIFLSFSSLDARQVLGIYLTLSGRGYVVYLDRVVDPQLTPANVTRKTAITLRRRMAQSRSLFVATSHHTPQSAWVPWELGFVDGWNGKTAILPIVASPQQAFAGRSYFEVYPEVHDLGTRPPKGKDLEILDQGTRLGTWDDWLAQPRVV